MNSNWFLRLNIHLQFQVFHQRRTGDFPTESHESFHEFIDRWCLRTLLGPDVFLGNVPISALGSRLVDDVEPHPARWFRLANTSIVEEGRVWIGSKGHASHLHFDAHDGLLVTITGRKRVWLYEPIDSVDRIPCFGTTNASSINPAQYEADAAMRVAWPAFAQARKVEIVLEPGEMLMIPVCFY
jgi:hypothetical protein